MRCRNRFGSCIVEGYSAHLRMRYRWVWAYRCGKGIHVHTNNGLERQNKFFKYRFLEMRKNSSISSMMTALIVEYLPDMMRKYIRGNAISLQGLGRGYNNAIPKFLHDRPQQFVRHCMGKIELAGAIPEEDITREDDSTFKVKSEVNQRVSYNVVLSDPRCECHSWRWNNWPCKHMFAAIEKFEIPWETLPMEYTSSPLITLDKQVGHFVYTSDHSEAVHVTVPEDCEFPSESTTLSDRKRGALSALKRSAIRCREALENVKDATYLCGNETILVEAATTINDVYQKIKDATPQDDGLVYLQSPPQKKKKTTRRVLMKRSHLPLYRKKMTQRKALLQRKLTMSLCGTSERTARKRRTKLKRMSGALQQGIPVGNLKKTARKGRTKLKRISGAQLQGIPGNLKKTARKGRTKLKPMSGAQKQGIPGNLKKTARKGRTKLKRMSGAQQQGIPGNLKKTAGRGRTKLKRMSGAQQQGIPGNCNNVGTSKKTTREERTKLKHMFDAEQQDIPRWKKTDDEISLQTLIDKTAGMPLSSMESLQRTVKQLPGFPKFSGCSGKVDPENSALSLRASLQKKYSSCLEELEEWMAEKLIGYDDRFDTRWNRIQLLGLVMLFAELHDIPPEEAVLTLQHIPGRMNECHIPFPRQGEPQRELVVCKTVVNADDIMSLYVTNQVHDQIIHAYLGLLAERSKENILIIPAFLPLLFGTIDSESEINQWLYTSETFSMYQWILMPICRNEHWFLLAVNIPQKTVSVLDSVPNKERKKWCHNFWLSFMETREQRKKEHMDDWSFKEIANCVQTTENACGVHVMMNSDAISRDLPPVIMRPCHEHRYRNFAARELLRAAKVRQKDTFCSLPFCQDPLGDDVEWVECDDCFRWFHLSCLAVAYELPEKYFCPFCQSKRLS